MLSYNHSSQTILEVNLTELYHPWSDLRVSGAGAFLFVFGVVAVIVLIMIFFFYYKLKREKTVDKKKR